MSATNTTSAVNATNTDNVVNATGGGHGQVSPSQQRLKLASIPLHLTIYAIYSDTLGGAWGCGGRVGMVWVKGTHMCTEGCMFTEDARSARTEEARTQRTKREAGEAGRVSGGHVGATRQRLGG